MFFNSNPFPGFSFLTNEPTQGIQPMHLTLPVNISVDSILQTAMSLMY